MLTEDDLTMPDNKTLPRLSAILAMDKNQLIGKEGALPWYLPADLQHFKKITLNHTVIMGRRTYASIGKPLPQRTNIILTHDTSFNAPNCLVAHSKEEALQLAASHEQEEAFIIGGALIYKIFMNELSRLYITEIDHVFSGDTYFGWDRTIWREVERMTHLPDEKNPYPYSFVVYETRAC